MVSAAGGVAACESHEASDNVAYTVASQNERRSALLVTSVFCLFALAIAPFGHRQLPEITTFLPAVVSCGFVAMALTASLLFAQFQAGGFTPLATLGLAYAASAALLLPYLLTFPRIFSPTGLLGAGAQSSTWLHVSWHLLFCALVALYVVFEKNGASAVTFRVTAYSTACVVFGTVLVATFGHAFLPALVQGNRSTLLFHAIVSPAVAVAVVLATVLLVATTRLRARCHLWLAVVLVALLVETLMINFESGARYSCGWYCARAVFLSASVIFLVMLQMQY
ncbi:MAG: MASE4 domain-containing protein, partial [Candidatus Eremiobacteraeota bacterium]|nr:MASE4 domain-containing protein [Candidatus Eremiobacteraeota bacterium]